MALTAEIEATTAIVKKLTEQANRIVWVPYAEIEPFFKRYSEALQLLQVLEFDVNDNKEEFLHDFGTRLIIRYRRYDNVNRTFRHGLFGDVALIEHQKNIPDHVREQYQHFYRDYWINLHITAEITHFAFVLVA